ncbi:MAG TPA: 3-deoxy-manno-octulosonate cytidylyltransferase [Planctomycetota bacterium]|nr:3-deoxy-manno-octulosonate cytidylyltransferase [Planctomycetota bacterium]
MRVAIILPARLQSTRLPNKLLLEAGGKTVLEHTIARAFEAQKANPRLITRVRVACDDEKLLAAAKRSGADAVMTRKDHQSGTDRIAEAAANIDEEIVVNLQADEPEIDPANIRLVAELLTARNEKAPMGTLVVPLYDEANFKKPNVVKVALSSTGYALYFSRAPIPFVRDESAESAALMTLNGRRFYGYHHLGIYAYRREFLLGYKKLPDSTLEKLEKLEQLRALEAGHAIKVAVASSNPPGIDTPEDYDAFLKRLKK